MKLKQLFPKQGRIAGCRGRLRRESGSIIVETALVMPIFLGLLFGTFEVAITLYNYCAATYACRIATRYASLHSNTSGNPTTQAQIQTIVTQNLMLASSNPYAVLLSYGDRSGGASGGNVVGDLVGVGVVWSNDAQWTTSGNPIWLSSESYRIISR